MRNTRMHGGAVVAIAGALLGAACGARTSEPGVGADDAASADSSDAGGADDAASADSSDAGGAVEGQGDADRDGAVMNDAGANATNPPGDTSDGDPPDVRVPPCDHGEDGSDASRRHIQLANDITADTTWTACNVYVILESKRLFVKNGATLTIEPGTVVQGELGSSLIVARGAKIIARGTRENPILFTAAPARPKTAGSWEGLVVLGAAPINNNRLAVPPSDEANLETFPPMMAEAKFGGNDPHDDSGTLRFVRIEFADPFAPEHDDVGNLVLAGVGDRTVIDYVQVHHGGLDGLRVVGGTVNLRHVVSSQNADDGLDVDNGWQGKAQFVVVQHVLPDTTAEPANGYEFDNHPTLVQFRADPRTAPTIYNATVLGQKDYAGGTSFAAVLRRGTGGKFFNHIFAAFNRGIEVRDVPTAEQATAGELFIKSSIFFRNGADDGNWPPPQASNDIDEKALFENPTHGNRLVDPGISPAAFSLTAPDFKPLPDGAAMTGGATPPDDGFFDVAATFVGAVGTEDWTASWTAYPQAAAP